MQVFIPRHSGFCPGVKKAQERIFEEKNQSAQRIYIFGHLIHNSNYIRFLDQNGMQTKEHLHEIPYREKLVIRTHGISKKTEDEIRKNYHVVDLTCLTVKKLQLKIEEYSQKGFYIVISGKKDHPEMVGLVSYAKDFSVIETLSDLESFLKEAKTKLKEKNYQKVLIASQTTGEESLYNKVCEDLIHYLSKDFRVELLNSICPITSIREREALILQKRVDVTFVIGDKKSSNAKKIFGILKQHHPETYFLEDLESLLQLNLPLKNYQKAQVVSSSSTPDFIEKEIKEYLEKV